jgi:hemerythrin
MFIWKKDYELGMEKIDGEHKMLFEIANKGYELLENQYYLDKYDKIVSILSELSDYAKFHFSEEEEYLKSIGYKKLFTHKIQHDYFIEKVNSVNLALIDSNQDKAILSILDFIVNWIQEHILEMDKDYTRIVNQ